MQYQGTFRQFLIFRKYSFYLHARKYYIFGKFLRLMRVCKNETWLFKSNANYLPIPRIAKSSFRKDTFSQVINDRAVPGRRRIKHASPWIYPEPLSCWLFFCNKEHHSLNNEIFEKVTKFGNSTLIVEWGSPERWGRDSSPPGLPPGRRGIKSFQPTISTAPIGGGFRPKAVMKWRS